MKNKPVPLPDSFLSSSASVKGTASQKWCLFRLLPQMIGHLLPEGHSAWELYLLYRHIVDIILADKVPVDSIMYLRVQIDAFLEKFTELFPNQKLIPKMHFLVHYPRFIRIYGPPRMYWSMRFEAKHSYFKNIAIKSKSFRNICKTMSTRGQLLQCYQFSAPCFSKPLVTSTQKAVKWSELPDCVKPLFPTEVGEDETLYSVRSASADASSYRVGDMYCVDWKEEAPLFAQVYLMVVHRGTLLIFVQVFDTLQFNHHRHSYEVQHSGVYNLLPPGQHLEYNALDLYEFQDKYEIIPYFEIYED
ncbi:uncharacterized protein LOC135384274 [Ornithodoros turicata]|uniref:uncharacterized protein LOC135384274 n=1 Tax=Ornithodoros turicata TaxID=34597 RepID=UPI003138C306